MSANEAIDFWSILISQAGALAYVRWRFAVSGAKAAIEVGQVAEAGLERDRADWRRAERIGDDAFWRINKYASDLLALGQVDAPIAALDRILKLAVSRYPASFPCARSGRRSAVLYRPHSSRESVRMWP